MTGSGAGCDTWKRIHEERGSLEDDGRRIRRSALATTARALPSYQSAVLGRR